MPVRYQGHDLGTSTAVVVGAVLRSGNVVAGAMNVMGSQDCGNSKPGGQGPNGDTRSLD